MCWQCRQPPLTSGGGGNLESAHAILAGLTPLHEIGPVMAMGKLMTVHLNDQNGIGYDQDKAFGVENLRAAFNQVKVLEGEWLR